MRLRLTWVLGRLGRSHSLELGPTLRASLSGTFLQTARFGYAIEGALFIAVQLSTDSGRVWRKVPESGARSVPWTVTSTLTQLLNYAVSFLSGVTKYGSG